MVGAEVVDGLRGEGTENLAVGCLGNNQEVVLADDVLFPGGSGADRVVGLVELSQREVSAAQPCLQVGEVSAAQELRVHGGGLVGAFTSKKSALHDLEKLSLVEALVAIDVIAVDQLINVLLELSLREVGGSH